MYVCMYERERESFTYSDSLWSLSGFSTMRNRFWIAIDSHRCLRSLRVYAHIKEYPFPIRNNAWVLSEEEKTKERERKRKSARDEEKERERLSAKDRQELLNSIGWSLVRSCCARESAWFVVVVWDDVVYVTFFLVCECLLLLVASLKLIFWWHKWFSCTEVLVRPERP